MAVSLQEALDRVNQINIEEIRAFFEEITGAGEDPWLRISATSALRK